MTNEINPTNAVNAANATSAANVEWPGKLTAAWLREQYLGELLTPAAVVHEIFQRSKRDEGMNIWITPPSPERIRPYLERLSDMDPEQFPLWGIPFAIKDNIDWDGAPTTAACPDFAYTPEESAVVVQRLIAAGAIPLGKTNLDQFATGLVGTRSPYGETHNALRPELISGGSSSGSAVAVARGQAVFALGTDTAGSGRVPAALNGLVGYKPSLGAWPTKGVVPACASLDCVTVFAHDLADALAVDAVARGAEAADPWSRSLPVPVASRLPAAVCLPEEAPAFYGPYAAQYRAAWEAAAAQVASLGIPVIPIAMDVFAEAAAILYGGPWVAERWAELGEFVNGHPGSAFPVTEQVLRTGESPAYTAASVFQAMHKLQQYKLQAGKLLKDAVLMLPTCGGTWTREDVRRDPIAANSDMGKYTNHCNLLDLCAVAVQAGEAAEDMPFGVTFFAAAENESLICAAAAAFAAARGDSGIGTIGVAGASGRDSEDEDEVAAATGNQPAATPGMQSEASLAITQELQLSKPAEASPPGTTHSTEAVTNSPEQAAKAATTLVAVCGLHMRGFPLEKQMLGCGAVFVRETESAPKYRLVKLPTVPAKPGMIKQEQGGAAITLEVWEMPLAAFGGFVAGIPAPLGIGKVELSDGSEVPGFTCEAYAAAISEDITQTGSWRKAVLM
ncbi:allophanate hydrolase [Paenibacillus rhizovicinus]|uniref:Allophanate hydrolase n=1 Tax=Paenibacillus rhizovicinus TaxID=2704463 RepID=A0A6C0PAD6_9BACL|nr:allophanate hydrolase [Paenibacillus rhizovicinus]QHW34603.1 allophanate hydrolase [Paenibacillus rhizovicinus]